MSPKKSLSVKLNIQQKVILSMFSVNRCQATEPLPHTGFY